MSKDVLVFKSMADASNVLPHITAARAIKAGASFVLSYNTTSMTGIATSTVYDIEHLIMAHIHAGNATSQGGVVYPLFTYLPSISVPRHSKVVFSTMFGTADLNPAQLMLAANATASAISTAFVAALQSANLYVNYHTTAYPAGEVRGQVKPHM
ncbi:MAG: hypothetical protein WDW36_006363 [Sanguina aurantia]